LGIETGLTVMFVLSFMSLGVPYGFPLFFPLAAVLCVWFFCVWSMIGPRKLDLSLNGGTALLGLCLIGYLMGLLWTGTIYKQNQKDLQNVLGVFLLLPALSLLSEEERFRRFRDRVQRWNVGLISALAVFSLYKFILLVQGVKIPFLEFEDIPYPIGTSLVMDYNFFAYLLIVGAVSSVYSFQRANSLVGKVANSLAFSIMLLSLVLAGSRRGWVLGGVGILGLACLFLAKGLRILLRAFYLGRVSRREGKAYLAAFILIVVGIALAGFYGQEAIDFSGKALERLASRLQTLWELGEAFESRTDRWEFSWALLAEDDLGGILLGQGFDYLRRLASEFMTPGGEDYPHNMIISTVLYSGAIGLLPVLCLLTGAFVRLYAIRRIDLFFLSVFSIAIVFLLSSLNSMFSMKFFLLLLMVAWVCPSMNPNQRHPMDATTISANRG
jgi:hypothetical protein